MLTIAKAARVRELALTLGKAAVAKAMGIGEHTLTRWLRLMAAAGPVTFKAAGKPRAAAEGCTTDAIWKAGLAAEKDRLLALRSAAARPVPEASGGVSGAMRGRGA